MKRSKLSKESYKMYSLRKKEFTRKQNRTQSYIQGDKQIKGNTDVKDNKDSGNLKAQQQADKLPTSEKEVKKNLGWVWCH